MKKVEELRFNNPAQPTNIKINIGMAKQITKSESTD